MTEDKHLVAEYDPHETEDRLQDEANWDMFTEILSQEMKHISSEYKHSDIFHISASSVGWLNKSGERIFNLENGLELIRKIAPDTSFRVKVHRYTDKKLDIEVFHHDSPTGEVYVVRPVYADVARTFNSQGEEAALERMA